MNFRNFCARCHLRHPAPRAKRPRVQEPGVTGPFFIFIIPEVFLRKISSGEIFLSESEVGGGSTKWDSQKNFRKCPRENYNCGRYMGDKHEFF